MIFSSSLKICCYSCLWYPLLNKIFLILLLAHFGIWPVHIHFSRIFELLEKFKRSGHLLDLRKIWKSLVWELIRNRPTSPNFLCLPFLMLQWSWQTFLEDELWPVLITTLSDVNHGCLNYSIKLSISIALLNLPLLHCRTFVAANRIKRASACDHFSVVYFAFLITYHSVHAVGWNWRSIQLLQGLSWPNEVSTVWHWSKLQKPSPT